MTETIEKLGVYRVTRDILSLAVLPILVMVGGMYVDINGLGISLKRVTDDMDDNRKLFRNHIERSSHHGADIRITKLETELVYIHNKLTEILTEIKRVGKTGSLWNGGTNKFDSAQ